MTHTSPSGKLGSKISDIPCSNIFANISPWARETKDKINKWDYLKFKSSCREPTVWGNTFVNDASEKSLISKKYKELI